MDYLWVRFFNFSTKKGRPVTAALWMFRCLGDGCRFTKMFLLHCHTSAAATDKFHSCQFVSALMGVIRFGSTTETAFGLIAARVAKMPGRIGDRTAVLACISHDLSP
jgi:hypothetical protein